MELQASLADYAAAGIAVFAVSYDSVETLRAFGERYEIAFPLLADEGSAVIRRLGHLSRQFAPEHANYGAAYPATYALDRDGVVVEKQISVSERERETAAGILEDRFGAASSRRGNEVVVPGRPVAIRAYLDSPTYRFGQRLRLTIELAIEDGWQVYGEPIPTGYVPLAVEVEPAPGLAVGATRLPRVQASRPAGPDGPLATHRGLVRLVVPLTFAEQVGDQDLRATVRFQCCRDTECMAPVAVPLSLPVQMLTHVERPS